MSWTGWQGAVGWDPAAGGWRAGRDKKCSVCGRLGNNRAEGWPLRERPRSIVGRGGWSKQ